MQSDVVGSNCGWAIGSGQARSRNAALRFQCSTRLKQIDLALHEYENRYHSFPPAYIADRNGKPMHSWRVLILPFLDETDVYNRYDFNEPWDGPNNRKLLDARLRCMRVRVMKPHMRETQPARATSPSLEQTRLGNAISRDVSRSRDLRITLQYDHVDETTNSGINWIELESSLDASNQRVHHPAP